MKLGSTLFGAVDSGNLRAALDAMPPLPRTQQPISGTLALVPMGEALGSKTLVEGFRAVAQKQGPVAAIQWLMRNNLVLRAVVKTPMGRGALVAATLGATVGWTIGSNVQKAQAVATALKAVADQNLPADQTARQVAQVLQAAWSNDARVTPLKDNTSWPKSTQPPTLDQLRIKLGQAEQSLEESKAVLEQNRLKNPGQADIVKAQSARVVQLRAKLDSLERAQTTRPPKEVPVVTRLPQALQESRPVVSVKKLPVVTEPPSPAIPKEIDRSAAGKKKVLDGAGDVTRRQRVEDYRKGGTREDAMDKLTGHLRHLVEADINAIDNLQLPPGGATGRRASDASNSASALAGGSKPTNKNPGPSWPLPGPVKPNAQENFDVWFGRGKPNPEKTFFRTEAQRHHGTDGTALTPQLKELLALEGPQPYANANLQGPPSEFAVDGAKPRVVYHGTDKKFHAFEHSQTHDSGWLGTGYYFTSDPKLAATYALARSRSPRIPAAERGRPEVVDVYISLRKPYVISNDQYDSGKLKKNRLLSEELTRILKQQGFDGVIFQGGGRTEYCIFKSPQIKSVHNNRGSYSPTNPDMRSNLPGRLSKDV